jgi:YggT family protein
LTSHPVSGLLQLYIIVIFVRVILSWFPIQPDSVFASIYRFVYAITEPVLGPIRRVMPGVGVGGMGLDFSSIIVLLLLQIILIPIVQRAGL